jgi:hypothetical protein
MFVAPVAAVAELAGKVPRYSFVHSFGRLAQEQGVLGLWRGNTPYLLRHVPSISMSFAFKVPSRLHLELIIRQRTSPVASVLYHSTPDVNATCAACHAC